MEKVSSLWVKQLASELGFDACGIARAERLYEDEDRLTQWLRKGYHGSMQYMENHFDKRLDPRLLVEGAQSVITLMLNYYPSQPAPTNSYTIAKYAYGKDYHDVIRTKLRTMEDRLREVVGDFTCRGFVDSAPVLERSWAVRSGLGWVGKNGNLIRKRQGSFYFLATLITDLTLQPDMPVTTDHCGSCTQCIDACPTEAILPNKEINGARCISYFTIELKESIMPDTKTWDNWIFGCDICQDVCPWNRFSVAHSTPEFEPGSEFLQFSKQDWEDLSELTFQSLFRWSPIKRAKYKGLMRNIRFVKSSDK
jgi:epoxyqueuosine reductase